LSALLASEMRARATDPAVRGVLATIERDEARHAEIAWATLRWAVDVGGAPVREALREVFAGASPSAGQHPAGVDPVLVGHGVLDRAVVQQVLDRGWFEIVRPCAALLLDPPAVEARV